MAAQKHEVGLARGVKAATRSLGGLTYDFTHGCRGGSSSTRMKRCDIEKVVRSLVMSYN